MITNLICMAVATFGRIDFALESPRITDGDKLSASAVVKNTTTNNLYILMATEHYPHLCIRYCDNGKWLDGSETLTRYPYGAPSPTLRPGEQRSFSVSVRANGSPITVGVLASTGCPSNTYSAIWSPPIEIGPLSHLYSGFVPTFPDIAFENPSPLRFVQEPFRMEDVLWFPSQDHSFPDNRVGIPYSATITTVHIEGERTNTVLESLPTVLERESLHGREQWCVPLEKTATDGGTTP